LRRHEAEEGLAIIEAVVGTLAREE